MILSACEKSRDTFDVHDDDLSTDQLAGVWIIDDDSLRFLYFSLHYRTFTCKANHVLLLNRDGTCAFKGFAVYCISGFGSPEVDSANGIENAMNVPEPKVITDRFCWCESLPVFPYIRGPYSPTSNITNDTTRAFRKTLWAKWRICKSEKEVDIEDYTQFRHWKYKICLDRPLPNHNGDVTYDGDTETNRTENSLSSFKGDSVDAYVGKDDKGLYLLFMAVFDDNPPTRGVKFRKVKGDAVTCPITPSQASNEQSQSRLQS